MQTKQIIQRNAVLAVLLVYYMTHAYLGADNPDPQAQHFSVAYHIACGGKAPDAFAALSYDAVNLIAEAIRHSGIHFTGGRPSPAGRNRRFQRDYR